MFCTRRKLILAAATAVAAIGVTAGAASGPASAAIPIGGGGGGGGGTSLTGSGNLFARVSSTGTLVSGTPGARVSALGTGQYEVTFPRNVSGCAYVATTINAYSQALQAYTASGHLSVEGVYVETKNQGGGLTAGPFNLVVDCGQPDWSYAVVGYSENLVRSTPGTTLSFLGTGQYYVNFPASVAGCAYLASVGDPGNSLVYNPAGVYTASSPNANSVYIETKNPGGGLSSGIPFHLAVVCPGATAADLAVVNASGTPARASSLTSSYEASTGSYVMITPDNLSACAVVGTRGSADTSAPYTPGTVEIIPGTGTTVGIQVRDLLNFGGNPDNLPFHAAAVC